MERLVRIPLSEKRPFPGMLHLIDKSIPAALAKQKGELLVDFLLEFLRIRSACLIQQIPQRTLDSFFRFYEHPVESGIDLDLNDIVQTPERKTLAASPTRPLVHFLNGNPSAMIANAPAQELRSLWLMANSGIKMIRDPPSAIRHRLSAIG